MILEQLELQIFRVYFRLLICPYSHSNGNQLGYYRFEECGEINNPTIGLIRGEKYEFIQVKNMYDSISPAL